ncbi:MAG: hypothetical protein Q7R43_03890 [Candidatus Daviesbacteria bacterium]|nr:hypothetical protein [Candidatus Daviesbacteria bacterium]
MKQRGISLIEIVLVAAAMIALALLLGTLPSSMSSINKSRQTSLAKEVTAKEIEYLRGQAYEDLIEGDNTFVDVSLDKLGNAQGSYEVKACSPTICTLNEDVKEIKVKVSWVEAGENKNVELSTLVSKGGIGQ